jgi:hypothetical protein
MGDTVTEVDMSRQVNGQGGILAIMRRLRATPRLDLLDLCPAFLTRQQAASVAGVTTRTVDRWLNDDETPLSAHRSAGARRFPLVSREELRSLLTVSPQVKE